MTSDGRQIQQGQQVAPRDNALFGNTQATSQRLSWFCFDAQKAAAAEKTQISPIAELGMHNMPMTYGRMVFSDRQAQPQQQNPEVRRMLGGFGIDDNTDAKRKAADIVCSAASDGQGIAAARQKHLTGDVRLPNNTAA